MSQDKGNDMAAPEPLANTDVANPPEAIEDKLNKLWYIALYRYEPAIRKEAIQAIITTETTNAKYKALQDLLDWQEQWAKTHSLNSEPFNFYGAIKAMQVMKDPSTPFHALQKEQP